jgi:hypothetical protein
VFEAVIQYESIEAAGVAVNEMRGFALGGPGKRIRIDYADDPSYEPPKDIKEMILTPPLLEDEVEAAAGSVEVAVEISAAEAVTEETTLGVSEAVMILMDHQVECDAWRTIIEVMTMAEKEKVMDPHV